MQRAMHRALFILIATLFTLAAGHGEMTVPPPRNQVGSQWFNEGCQIGCSKCAGWTQPCCNTTMEPTLTDPTLRTYMDISAPNPWRAPGYAPVESPCGLASGWYEEHAQGGGLAPPGFKAGFDGRSLPALNGTKTEWPAGSAQEVAWHIDANHGGGYAYRLCPKSEHLTEKCFQNHHLRFVGEHSWIQRGSNLTNRTEIRANRTSEGTNPQGSQWTKVPIPSCSGPGGGYDGKGCDKPQFDSPIPGLWGNGPGNGCAHNPMPATERAKYCGVLMDFHIVDKVLVPRELPSGDYVLSFRWDCEQTPQIWTQCADITVTANRDGVMMV